MASANRVMSGNRPSTRRVDDTLPGGDRGLVMLCYLPTRCACSERVCATSELRAPDPARERSAILRRFSGSRCMALRQLTALCQLVVGTPTIRGSTPGDARPRLFAVAASRPRAATDAGSLQRSTAGTGSIALGIGSA